MAKKKALPVAATALCVAFMLLGSSNAFSTSLVHYSCCPHSNTICSRSMNCRLDLKMTFTISAEQQSAKTTFINTLKQTKGEPSNEKVREALDNLSKFGPKRDESLVSALTGEWRTITKPDFPSSAGQTEAGDYLFTLGRMSFDMYQPSSLLCSINSIDNPVLEISEASHVPKSFQDAVKDNPSALRLYTVLVSFTIEEGRGKGIKGIMKNDGFLFPDPKVDNRVAVWFTGGTMYPTSDVNISTWIDFFGGQAQAKKGFKKKLKAWLVKLLFGIEAPSSINNDNTLSYTMKKSPMGYLDVLYTDEDLRITRGNRGSIVVAERIPEG